MGERTALYERHLRSGARMVDFGGWDMPVHYGSQLREHHQVRGDVGMFDVSHLSVVDIGGRDARTYLQYVLANNVARLKFPGKAQYSCMLNERGGVVDDLVVFFFAETDYRVVLNAATRAKDLAWMERHTRGFDVKLSERADLATIAVQGPNSRAHVLALLDPDDRNIVEGLEVYQACDLAELFVARTGYTGEEGYELVMANAEASSYWQRLLAAGVPPVGLGARDTLRLEAGLSLYGADMDEDVSPLECGLGWTVAWQPGERAFVGRAALEQQRRDGPRRERIGLVLEGKGVLRAHQKVWVDGVGEGIVTSGSFSPTLGRSIALARVPASTAEDNAVSVDVRGRPLPARVVKPPFARQGQARIAL